MNVTISRGNKKMRNIASVSLPSGKTCRNDCECSKICYAKKLERMRPSVAQSYEKNLKILQEEPEKYWREVEAAIMLSRFFRFHVSGDAPNPEYFYKVAEIAARNPHCEILMFTKRYEWVNQWLDRNPDAIPKNLHIILSVWRNLDCSNPHNLPEAHIIYKDGTTTVVGDAYDCNDNCEECAVTGQKCWVLKRGEKLRLKQH